MLNYVTARLTRFWEKRDLNQLTFSNLTLLDWHLKEIV